MKKHLIFVYGSLKQGCVRHGALRGQRYLGVAITEPEYGIFQLSGYPALVDQDTANEHGQLVGRGIWGELYEVDEGCLVELDRIEGVSSGLFQRREIKLQTTNVAFLPTDDDVFSKLHRKTAECYYYLRSVAGAKDCGSFWCH